MVGEAVRVGKSGASMPGVRTSGAGLSGARGPSADRGYALRAHADSQWAGPPSPAAAGSLPVELAAFEGVVDPATLRQAARRAREIGVGGDEVLRTAGVVEEADATRALAARLGVPVGDAAALKVPDGETARGLLRTGLALQARPDGPPDSFIAVQGRAVRRVARALRADPGLARRTRLIAPSALRRHLMDTHGEMLAEAATTDLVTARPAASAATLRPLRLVIAGAAAGATVLGGLFFADPAMALLLVQAVLSLIFLSWIVLRLAGCAYTPPEDPELDLEERRLPVYSVLVPLYREAAVVPRLVTALSALDYPPEKLDIKLVVEADDHETRAAIAATRLPAFMEEVAVANRGPRTKPKALDVALAFARGQYVAIYDAEDEPEPDQLRRALAAFRAGGRDVACVQARLAVDNGEESWISGHFQAEYAGQFDVLLPVLAGLGLPILLGGTSNHFRRDVLEQVGAWDPFNVTEDADLGIRLARAGWRTAVISSSTFEEAPISLSAWLKQRTRWLKGWMQTILVHARHPRTLVRDLGGEATAAFALLTAGPLAAALVHPFCLALLARDMALGVIGLPCTSMAEVITSALTYTTLLVGYAGTALTNLAGLGRRGIMGRWTVVATIPFYWLLLSAAAWRAFFELIRRPHHWDKTEHGLSRRARALRNTASAPPQHSPAAAWY